MTVPAVRGHWKALGARGVVLALLFLLAVAPPLALSQTSSTSSTSSASSISYPPFTAYPATQTEESQIAQLSQNGTIAGTILVGTRIPNATGFNVAYVTRISSQENALNLTLQAEGVSGFRMVQFNLTKTSILNMGSGLMLVTEDNATLSEVATLGGLVSAAPSFTVISSSSGYQILVSIPHFASHTIILETPPGAQGSGKSSTSLIIYGVGVAVIAAVVVVLVFSMRGARQKRMARRAKTPASRETATPKAEA